MNVLPSEMIGGEASELPMGFLGRQAKVETLTTSGVLSVRICPNRHWLLMLAESALIIFMSVRVFRTWGGLSFATRAIFLFVDIGAVFALLYQLSGSELIEFDQRQLRISKEILAWNRVIEHAIENCSELEVHEQHEDDNYGLQCKVGWRTIRFGQYLSEEQALEVLAALQRELPDVAQKSCAIKQR